MSETSEFLRGLLDRFHAAVEIDRPIPDTTPPVGHRRMCVGMATYDDPAGVWFTIQAIRLFHPEMADKLSFLILDNHPTADGAPELKSLDAWIPTLRYIPFRGYRSTAVRDLIFREADADIVCCLDSHVLLAPGALAAIDRYFAERPDSLDMIQGPLLSDALDGLIATHLDPIWSAQQFGRWAVDDRIHAPGAEPFEIGMHGLGLFACRREAWPGFNPRFRGYGGEEGYIQEKVRLAGGRVLCHPAAGWAHRAPANPAGVSLEGFLRNYLIGWREIGWETSDLEQNYRALFGTGGWESRFEELLERVRAEATAPLSFFDGIFCVPGVGGGDEYRTQAERRRELLGIGWQVERRPAVDAADSVAVRASSLRDAVAEARRRAYEHVLVLDDDAILASDAATVLAPVIEELRSLTWDLCLLGGSAQSQAPPGDGALRACGEITSMPATAVHSRAYDRILEWIPAEPEALSVWLREAGSHESFINARIAAGELIAVVTPPLLERQPVAPLVSSKR
jgi:hypothetical protein